MGTEDRRFLTAFLFGTDDRGKIVGEAIDLFVVVGDDGTGIGEGDVKSFVVTFGKQILEVVDRGLGGGVGFVADILEALVEVDVLVDVEQIHAGNIFDALDVLAVLAKEKGMQIFEAAREFGDLLFITEGSEQREVE